MIRVDEEEQKGGGADKDRSCFFFIPPAFQTSESRRLTAHQTPA